MCQDVCMYIVSTTPAGNIDIQRYSKHIFLYVFSAMRSIWLFHFSYSIEIFLGFNSGKLQFIVPYTQANFILSTSMESMLEDNQ